MELILKLKDKYGVNEPITTDEIIRAWSSYSRPRIFQLLKKFTEDKLLIKFETGIYYIPTQTIFGVSRLSPRKVIEKKYIKSNNEYFGYYGGISLLNALQLTTQVPNDLEIISDKAPAVVRDITVGVTKVKIRRSRIPINKNNLYALMLLEVFNIKGCSLSKSELTGVKEFIKTNNVNAKDVFNYAQYFPAKTIKNLITTGVENVFTQ